jgi:hypothetical protein
VCADLQERRPGVSDQGDFQLTTSSITIRTQVPANGTCSDTPRTGANISHTMPASVDMPRCAQPPMGRRPRSFAGWTAGIAPRATSIETLGELSWSLQA